jgi:Mannosyltransferase OCH1 and related enzymes
VKKLCIGLLFVSLVACAHDFNDARFRWVYHDFETLMVLEQYPKAVALTNNVLQYDGQAFFNLGQKLYNAFNPSVLAPQEKLIIPKIIHQIWIGSPLPEVFKKYMETWQELHPDWQYVLWTDEKVEKELFPLYNQKFYDESDSMGVKSDLLKWEIIYRFGGVYADVDFECLQPLDRLHYTYDFYTAYQPLDAFFVQLGAALYAGYPRHPILKHCIETIKDDWHHKGAPKKSGPCHFSKSFLAIAGQYGRRDIAFPAFYFYPQGSTERDLKYDEWVEKGAYAIHHWAKSWMPVNTRRQEFRTFDNKKSSEVWND